MKNDHIHHRRNLIESSPANDKSIKKRLKEYMGSVAMDLFGYEKLVNKSVRSFAQEVAKRQGVALDQVFVRITQPNETLRVYLHVGGRLIRELTVRELVQFFVGLQDTETTSRVAKRVGMFLEDYAHQQKMNAAKLQILISSSREGSVVRSFHSEALIEEIPVKVLIQYFKS